MAKIIIDLTAEYQGYLWFSDSAEPKVYDGELIDSTLFDSVNPFIIEGYLYNSDKNVSYSIKYVDGETIVKEYSCDALFKNNAEKLFYANRMGDRLLKFLDVWTPEKDPLCEGMEVLQPKAKVFVGFENLNKKEDKYATV